MKHKMLILTNRTLHNGPRMIREFATFQNDFEITAIGTTPPLQAEIHFEPISQFKPFFFTVINAICRRLYYNRIVNFVAEYYPALFQFIYSKKFDVVIIHDPTFLPLIQRLKKKINFVAVYNAHEYHPLEFEDKVGWTDTFGRYQFVLYKKYLSSIDLLVNVCEGIAGKCKAEFQKESIVIPNVAMMSEVKPTENSGIIKLIYHGAIMKSRNIEDMIDVVAQLGNSYSLDIMGMVSNGNEEYFESLKQYALKAGNTKFVNAVAFDQIITTINKYDIGLFLLRPNNFNYTHALPNKLYEFIQAKLAIAIGPSVEMKQVVDQYELGVVGDDFSASNLAEKIRGLTREDILRYKNHAVAASLLENAAVYSAKYLAQVKKLLH